MKINSATNFQDNLVDGLYEINLKYSDRPVTEVYGSYKISPFGSARPSTGIPKTTHEEIERHIKKLNKNGIHFNYALNASCCGNIEHTYDGIQTLDDFLRELKDMGVDSVAVSIPFFIDRIKRRYPEFKVKASTVCGTRTVQAAKRYEDMGADKICLDISANRNFPLLKAIREAVDSEIEIIVNTSCLLNCPYMGYHYNLSAHGSQSIGAGPKNYINHPRIRCLMFKLGDISEMIKSPWVRPEDLHYYEEIGIDSIKISGRELPTQRLLMINAAYASGRFDGNLRDLAPDAYYPPQFREILGGEKLPELDLHINNRDLDGFLDFIIENEIQCDLGCGSCIHCAKTAEKTISIDGNGRTEYLRDLQKVLEKITDEPDKELFERLESSWREKTK